jgi:hypothetical protein
MMDTLKKATTKPKTYTAGLQKINSQPQAEPGSFANSFTGNSLAGNKFCA